MFIIKSFFIFLLKFILYAGVGLFMSIILGILAFLAFPVSILYLIIEPFWEFKLDNNSFGDDFDEDCPEYLENESEN